LTSSTEHARREVGERLRRARETAGLSVRDLADRTRISARHIQALEEGEFGAIQGFIFVRGFVSSICRELRQDPAELMVLLKSLEPEEPAPLPPQPATETIRVRHDLAVRGGRTGRKGGGRSSIAALIAFYGAVTAGMVFLVLLMMGIVAPVDPGGADAITATGAAVASADAPPAVPGSLTVVTVEAPPTAVDGPVSTAGPPPVPAPTAAPAGPSTSAAPAGPSTSAAPAAKATADATADVPGAEMRLRITALEKTWLKVQADDQPAQEMTLNQDTEAEFVGRERFTLTIGNAGGIALDLNGRDLGSPGSPGQVIGNYVLTRDDL
jgi:cytoskeleton protein RodZ